MLTPANSAFEAHEAINVPRIAVVPKRGMLTTTYVKKVPINCKPFAAFLARPEMVFDMLMLFIANRFMFRSQTLV